MQVKHLGVMRERNFAAADSGSDCSSTPLSHGARAAAAAADAAQRRLRLVSSLFELFLPSDSHSHRLTVSTRVELTLSISCVI